MFIELIADSMELINENDSKRLLELAVDIKNFGGECCYEWNK
ncbi:hypothetical protein [uncultured Clostridium sp.]|nr:hypothetical protein [uncultured Clostridium sp.]